VTDTRALYGQMVDGQFRYSPDRVEQVHDVYVGQQIRQGVPVERPTATIMGGGPASGKSTVINSGDVKLPKGHVLVNPDDAKDMIPEYRAGVAAKDFNAAAFAHEESSDMAKRLMRESLDGSYNTVLDGTGDGSFDGLSRKIASAREHGATRIVGEYVTLDTDEAVRRAAVRAAESVRGVPEEVIRGTHAAVSDVFPKAAAGDLFDELRLYDNNFSTPVLIYEKVAGVERVIDADAYRQFLAKANP
jgi:predicted ABC-type ATPase